MTGFHWSGAARSLAARGVLLASGLFAFLVTPASAQDFRQSVPRLLDPVPPAVEALAEGPRAAGDETPILPALKAVRFVPGTEWLPHPPETTPLEIVGLPVLDTPAFRARAEADLGKPASIASLNALARAAVAAYRADGRPLVDVAVPEQDVTEGTVTFVVREFVAGDVRIEGNRHFPTERLRAMVRLEPGQAVDQNALVDDLNRIAENPFRRVDLLYRRGEAPLTTDVVVRVTDRLPLRIYGSFENNGSPAVGRERFAAGFNWGNAFGADGQLAYQFTTSKDLFEDRRGLDPRFQAHSLTLVQPVSRTVNLILFSTYQRTAPDLGPFVGLTGEAWQFSPRLAYRLLSRPDARAQLTLGYDFKQTDNDLLFGGTTISTDSTEIHQLIADLTLSRRWTGGLFAISTTIHASPGGIGSRNTDRAFQPGPNKIGTPFARATYAYWRTTVTQTTPLFGPTAELVTRVTGQLATGNLLPTEQLSIAGPGLVRAYDPNAVLGANGLSFTQEFWGPAVPLLKRGPSGDSLRLGGFVDAGVVSNPDRLPGEPRARRTASVGAMARYRLGPAVDLRVDYGTQLRAAPGSTRRSDRAFVSLIIGF